MRGCHGQHATGSRVGGAELVGHEACLRAAVRASGYAPATAPPPTPIALDRASLNGIGDARRSEASQKSVDTGPDTKGAHQPLNNGLRLLGIALFGSAVGVMVERAGSLQVSTAVLVAAVVESDCSQPRNNFAAGQRDVVLRLATGLGGACWARVSETPLIEQRR